MAAMAGDGGRWRRWRSGAACWSAHGFGREELGGLDAPTSGDQPFVHAETADAHPRDNPLKLVMKDHSLRDWWDTRPFARALSLAGRGDPAPDPLF
eukprot:1189901-Prymnesium_polylepis.1